MSPGAAARLVAAGACVSAAATGPAVTSAHAAAAVQPCSRGLVALTFDDGPAAAVTSNFLDVLSARQVPRPSSSSAAGSTRPRSWPGRPTGAASSSPTTPTGTSS